MFDAVSEETKAEETTAQVAEAPHTSCGAPQRPVAGLLHATEEGPTEDAKLLVGSPSKIYELVKTKDAAFRNVDATDDDGWTALIFAARHNDATALQRLLRCGANARHQDSRGRTALLYAARNNCADVVPVLAASGVDVNELCGGSTALMAAAAEGKALAVGALLRCGADPDVKDRYGRAGVAHVA